MKAAPCSHVSPVSTLRERAFQVFGSEITGDLVDLGPKMLELRLPPPYVAPNARDAAMEKPEGELAQFALEGLISGPHVQKLNRNSVYLFVNGRLIRDRVAAACHLCSISQLDARRAVIRSPCCS